jgi:hypothetical protein
MTVLLGGNENPYKRLTNSGWKSLAPGTHDRTVMKKQCGTKCFLGPKKDNCFPICAKKTCKVEDKGVMAAYMRARQQASMTRKRSRTKRSSAKRSSAKRSSAKRSISKRSTKSHRHSHKAYMRIAARAKKILTRKGYKVGK